jgi:anti-sigma B factor antagonist
MADVSLPVYLVDTASEPVMIRIQGRASLQNSSNLRDFLREMRREGRQRFVIDFHHCTSMDSTFLGVLAGAALELRKAAGVSSFVLCRIGERNLELVKNLGLDRLLVVDTGECVCAGEVVGQPLAVPPKATELENARLVLAAHESLIAVDEANRVKFQDVLSFLKSRVAEG